MKSSSNLLRRAGLTFLGLGAAATALAFAFTLNSRTGLPIKWPAGSIPITIMLGDATTLTDGSNYNTSARTAATAWNAVIGSAQLQVTFTTGTAAQQTNSSPPQPVKNEMAFAATIFGKDFGDGVLAVTTGFSQGNQRTEADILFNNKDRTWDSYRGSMSGRAETDIQRVAIHELGHLLGLDHPNEAVPAQSVNAIMNSRISSVDTLTSDDIEGARSLYGPPGAPANDAFANAIAISLANSGTTTVKGVNTNATKEGGEPDHAANNGGRSVWWRWTAPSAGSVTLDTGKVDPTTNKIDLSNGKSSYYDTTLAVYTGTTLSGLTSIASDDDIEDGVVQASTVTFNATGGTIYRFAVDGFNNGDASGADNGGITLNLTFASSASALLPVITTQPASLTVNSGSNASFSVVATSTAPLTYQWLFNTNPIAGATSATLSLTSVTSAQAGTYSVMVGNTTGSVTSNGAMLTVNAPPPPTPPAPPPTSGGGGGGGGGAPSLWFYAILAGLGLARLLQRNRQRNILD